MDTRRCLICGYKLDDYAEDEYVCGACLDNYPEAQEIEDKARAGTTFTVWVGGIEVNDHYLTLVDANALAMRYQSEGYDDVAVRKES